MEVKVINSQYDPANYNRLYRNSGSGNNIKENSNSVPLNYSEQKKIEDELIKSIESANDELVIYDRRFEFSIHEKTKQIMVKIVDISTEEVIREIPPEKILDLVAALWEISGLIIDERV